MITKFTNIAFFLLLLFTLGSCSKIAHVFYSPDMCKEGKQRKGKFKQTDVDRRAKSGQ